MSNTAVRYLTVLWMVRRNPEAITATELVGRLGEQGFSKDAMMQAPIMSGVND